MQWCPQGTWGEFSSIFFSCIAPDHVVLFFICIVLSQPCPSPCPGWSANTLPNVSSSELKSLVDKKKTYMEQGFVPRIPLNEYLVNEWWATSYERMLLFSTTTEKKISAPCIPLKPKPHRFLCPFLSETPCARVLLWLEISTLSSLSSKCLFIS